MQKTFLDVIYCGRIFCIIIQIALYMCNSHTASKMNVFKSSPFSTLPAYMAIMSKLIKLSTTECKLGLGRVPRAPEYSPGQTITRVANQHPGTPYRTGFPVLTLHTSAALLLMASVIPFHRYQPRSDQFITAKVKTGQSTSQLCEPPGPYKAKCLWTAPGWPVTGCAGPSHTSLLEIDVYGSLRPRPLRFLIGGRCG